MGFCDAGEIDPCGGCADRPEEPNELGRGEDEEDGERLSVCSSPLNNTAR